MSYNPNSAIRFETLTGTINGVNTVFTTKYNYLPGMTRIFYNGLLLKEGSENDYIESGNNQIIFSIPPNTGDTLLIQY